MAISFVAATNAVNNSGTSAAPAVPTGVADGDVLVAVVSQRLGSTATITAPAGWTQIGAQQNVAGAVLLGAAIFRKVASGESGTYTFSWGSVATKGVVIVAAFRGVDNANPVAANAGTTNASGNTTIPALTLGSGTYELVSLASVGTGTTYTPPTGFTEETNCDVASGAGQPISRNTSELAHESFTGSNPGATSATPASAAVGAGFQIALTPGGQSVAANTTTETDAAQAFGRAKSRAVSVTTETDTPVALTRSKSRAIATVTETDTPISLTGRKSRTIGITTESDAAQPITRQGHLQAVGTVVETDTAVALGRSKSRALATVTESDATVALGRAKTRAVATTTETDTVVPIAGRKTRALSLVTETDTALGVTRGKSAALTPATESDAVVAFGRAKLRALALVQETDLAVPITSGGHVVAVGTVTETDAAQGFVRTKSRALATVTETDAVVPVVAVKTRGLAVVNETDFAVSITAPIQLGPQNGTTTPTRWGGNGSRQRANGASSGRTRGHGSSGQSGAE